MVAIITRAQHRALIANGAVGYLAGSLAGFVRCACNRDPEAVFADMALSDIAQLREALNELELAVVSVKADGEAVAA